MLTPIFLTVLMATPAPALPVELHLEPRAGAATQLVYRLKNAGASPVRVAVHRGLLSLEVQVPGRRRAKVRCTPPVGTRPSSIDPERVTELAPGASKAEVVDLRWFCWNTRAAKALATPGATISGRYGFRGRANARKWIASTADGATRVAGVDAEAVALPTPAAPAPESAAGRLELRVVPERMEGGSGRSIAATLRLQNASPDDVRVYVRPELFGFDVRGPTQAVHCALGRRERAPMRESFTRLAPRRRTTLVLDLSAVCPDDTFDTPGIYDVTPIFDATEDGARVGLTAVTGTVRGRPFVIRVGRGDLSSYELQEPDR